MDVSGAVEQHNVLMRIRKASRVTTSDTSRITTLESAMLGKASTSALATVASSIPGLAGTAPAPLALAPAVGSGSAAARSDHAHQELGLAGIVTLSAAGTALWSFTRLFDAKPALGYMVFQASGQQPVVVEASSWVMGTGADAAKYAGVNVKGYRSQQLPALTSVSGILTAVITGVNGLVSALSNFNVFGGGSLSGVEVHLIARDRL